MDASPPGFLRELHSGLAALLWPTRCVGCGAPDRDFCYECLDWLRARRLPMPAALPGGIPVLASGRYEGPLRALIIGVKHEGRVGFARLLGPMLRGPLSAAWARRSSTHPPVVVAVPSRPSRVRRRGYRHVELILRVALKPMASPHLPLFRALRTLPGRKGQVGLDRGERERNAALIAVRRHGRAALRGREAILVDDIVTTGATAAAACSALAAEGARVLAVVALGAVPPRGDPADAPEKEGHRRKQ